MYIFQIISFIFEIISGILLCALIALCPDIILKNNKDMPARYVNPYKFESNKINARKVWNIIGRTSWFIIVMAITIAFLKSYFLDIPKFVKGNFYYVEGYVRNIKTEKKDFHEYVTIDGNMVSFFFSSGVELGKEYKIGYLPNSKRAISVEVLNNNQVSKDKKIAFPYKDILLFIAIIGVFILLIAVSPYLKFKLLMVTSVIFYPLSVFLYINQGLKLGLWFSFFNQGLLFMTIGIITDVIIFLSYISENRKDAEIPVTLIFAQFMSISKLLLLAETYQILLKK